MAGSAITARSTAPWAPRYGYLTVSSGRAADPVMCVQVLNLHQDLQGFYVAAPVAMAPMSQCDVAEVGVNIEEGAADDGDPSGPPTVTIAFISFAVGDVFDFLDDAPSCMTLYKFAADLDVWPDTENVLAAAPADFLPAPGDQDDDNRADDTFGLDASWGAAAGAAQPGVRPTAAPAATLALGPVAPARSAVAAPGPAHARHRRRARRRGPCRRSRRRIRRGCYGTSRLRQTTPGGTGACPYLRGQGGGMPGELADDAQRPRCRPGPHGVRAGALREERGLGRRSTRWTRRTPTPSCARPLAWPLRCGCRPGAATLGGYGSFLYGFAGAGAVRGPPPRNAPNPFLEAGRGRQVAPMVGPTCAPGISQAYGARRRSAGPLPPLRSQQRLGRPPPPGFPLGFARRRARILGSDLGSRSGGATERALNAMADMAQAVPTRTQPPMHHDWRTGMRPILVSSPGDAAELRTWPIARASSGGTRRASPAASARTEFTSCSARRRTRDPLPRRRITWSRRCLRRGQELRLRHVRFRESVRLDGGRPLACGRSSGGLAPLRGRTCGPPGVEVGPRVAPTQLPEPQGDVIGRKPQGNSVRPRTKLSAPEWSVAIIAYFNAVNGMLGAEQRIHGDPRANPEADTTAKVPDKEPQ
jgi:hypothetical protein